MEQLERLYNTIQDLGCGSNPSETLAPLQVARLHQWDGKLAGNKKRKFDAVVDKIGTLIGENESAFTKLPEGSAKNRKRLQLKELAKSRQVDHVQKVVDRVKLFCTYDTDQRKFGIEKALGLHSLALPTKITEMATKVELEIYNSLSDEKKIYLNTEDLLIELKYDVTNKEKPVAVDISLTENDEEVKLVAEAADLLMALNGENGEALQAMLLALIQRTSRAVAFLKRDPPVYMRKREAELEAKLQEDSSIGNVSRVMQGIRVTLLDMPGIDRVTRRVRKSNLKQYSIIGIDDCGRFNVRLSPEIVVGHAGLHALRNKEVVDSSVEEVEDPSIVLPLSYLAGRPVRSLDDLFKTFPTVQTTVLVKNVRYKFILTPRSPYNAATAIRQFDLGETEAGSTEEAVVCFKKLHRLLQRLALYNCLLKSCFAVEHLELGTSQSILPVSQKKLILRKRLNGEEETDGQTYNKEVVVSVKCFPNKFIVGLEALGKSLRINVCEDLKISVDSDGLDDKAKMRLCAIVQHSSSLVLCVHKWCDSL